MGIHDSYRRCCYDPFREYLDSLTDEEYVHCIKTGQKFHEEFERRPMIRLFNWTVRIVGWLVGAGLFYIGVNVLWITFQPLFSMFQ